jgi:hypothetical protein
MIRRFSVAAFAGAGAAAGERVDDAVADLVPPAETISVPPRTTVDALTEPSEDTINRALLPVTALAARTIDNRREVSAIMHHREARVGHLRARAWGHVWTAPWQELFDGCRYGRVRSRVRPFGAALMTAGPNAFRRSGPNRKRALDGALTREGLSDPWIRHVCITSFSPSQFRSWALG